MLCYLLYWTLVLVETGLWLPLDVGCPRWWQLPWHNPGAPCWPGQDEEPHHQEVEALDWHSYPGQLPGHPPRCRLLSCRLRWFCSMNTIALLLQVRALVGQLLLLVFSFAFGSSGWTLSVLVLTWFWLFLGMQRGPEESASFCSLFGLRFSCFLSLPKLLSTSFGLQHFTLNFTYFLFSFLFCTAMLSCNQAVCDGYHIFTVRATSYTWTTAVIYTSAVTFDLHNITTFKPNLTAICRPTSWFLKAKGSALPWIQYGLKI